MSKANKLKNILTEEITAWLKNELNNSDDDIIKQAFGNKEHKSTDYFFQADSLRLRSAGYKILKIFFDHEEFDHGRPFYVGEILILSENMNAPFYIIGEKIVIFSHENIVMCKLAGDVVSWLNNLS